jgi:hypothetical protein
LETIVSIDFAFLPIGDNFTMGVDNAIICCKEFINCSEMQLACITTRLDYIKIDQEEAKNKFSTQGKKLTLLQIGETISK